MPFANGFVPTSRGSADLSTNREAARDPVAESYEGAYRYLREQSGETGNLTERNAAPPSGASTIFWLGTDNLGRDVLSRLLYSIRLSLVVGLCAMALSLLLGSLIGFASGLSRSGVVDQILMRIVDLFLAVPALFLIIAVVAFFGNSTVLLISVLAGTGWMNVARMVRGEVLHIRGREFMLAAHMLGRSTARIVIDHVIPNILPTVIVAAVLQLSNVILAEASLSFLGLGIQPPTPSLGNMIGESLAYFDRGWWVGVFPGLVLTLLVVSVNGLAENLQHQLEIGREHQGELR
jgi:peptide/nickel transport system permease protein